MELSISTESMSTETSVSQCTIIGEKLIRLKKNSTCIIHFLEKDVFGTVITVNRLKHYAFIKRFLSNLAYI